VVDPSRNLQQNSFVLGGREFPEKVGRARQIGDIPLSKLRRVCCRSRINLNITREPHATVFASSSLRLFELAAMGCCIVSNPCEGMEQWFEAGSELLVVTSAAEATETYRRLLADDEERARMGALARARVMGHHTHRHRAGQIVRFLRDL